MLNTATSIGPRSRSTRSTSSVICSSLRASTPNAMAAPPALRIDSTSGASLSPWRRTIAATKPSLAKRRAMAPPSASPAPITSATCLSIRPSLTLPRARRRGGWGPQIRAPVERVLDQVQPVLAEEHLVVDEEGRRAEHAALRRRLGMGFERLLHRVVGDARQHRRRVDAGGGEHAGQHRVVVELLA